MKREWKPVGKAVILSAVLFAAVCSGTFKAQASSGEDQPSAWMEQAQNRGSWQEAYLSVLDSMGDYTDFCCYSLIYVDSDDVPEFVCDTQAEASGCQIYTWHNGLIDQLQTSRLHYTYMDHANLLCNSDGHMGYYYDDIFSIYSGRWVLTSSGSYTIPEDGSPSEYEWNGQYTDEAGYQEELKASYGTDIARYPDAYYTADEARSVLTTGHTSSVNHTYKFVRADVTWNEAQAQCKAMGGYLAALTTREEFDKVQELMLKEGMKNCVLWVGANRDNEYYGYYWMTPQNDYDMIMHEYFDMWLEGEPSYEGAAEDGRELDEKYVCMLYLSSYGRAFLNDVPDMILDAAPSYKGIVGYICEFD